MIAAENETCGGVVINQTNVTCPEVLACLPFATPAETVTGTSTTTIVNPADLTAKLANQPAAGVCTDREDVVWNGAILQGAAKHYTKQVLLYQGNTGALTVTDKILGTYTITNPSACRIFEGRFEAFLQANANPPYPQAIDSVLVSTSLNGLLVGAGNGTGHGAYQTTYGADANTWFNEFFTIPAGGSLTFDVLAKNGAGTTMAGYLSLKYFAHTV